jgi:hypothetical protein
LFNGSRGEKHESQVQYDKSHDWKFYRIAAGRYLAGGEIEIMNYGSQNAEFCFRDLLESIQTTQHNSETSMMISGYCPPVGNPLPVLSNLNMAGILYVGIDDFYRLYSRGDAEMRQNLVDSMFFLQEYAAGSEGIKIRITQDSLIAEFADAGTAFYCAVNMQQCAHGWNEDSASNRQIHLRTGVALGCPQTSFEAGNRYAAWFEKFGSARDICVSQAVLSELEASETFSFYAMGKKHITNLDKPVQAFWVVCEARPNSEKQNSTPRSTGSGFVNSLLR